MKNLPVGFVDCPYTCKITRLKPVSTKTLCQNVLALFKIFLQSHLATSIPKKDRETRQDSVSFVETGFNRRADFEFVALTKLAESSTCQIDDGRRF